jgi:membrane-associated phospholipid phosphatase
MYSISMFPACYSMKVTVLALFLILGVCFPAIAQDAQDTAPPTSDVQAIPEGTQSTQPAQSIQSEKPENPAEPEAHGTRLRWKDLPKNLWKDQKAIASSPLHINRDNAKWWILFGAGTAALLATDREVSDHLPQSNTQLRVSRWASRAGADYTIYPLTALFYFYGKADNNPRARDTARIGIEALADAEITVNVLKAITQRPRPETKNSSLGFWEGGDAFPSGHSIQAWALARVIAREFPEHRVFPILAYGLASTVSVARVAGRRHSPSDAFVGSAMGFFIGDYVYRHHHAPSTKANAALWLANHVNIGFQVSH